MKLELSAEWKHGTLTGNVAVFARAEFGLIAQRNACY